MISVDLQKNIDPNLLTGRATKLEKAMAWQIFKDTDPFVPMKTGIFAHALSFVKDNFIFYGGPYARYLYYGNRMVNSLTGKGPMYIPEVGWRWPKGATLRPTDEPLHISTAVHKDATSHWMEASKARNMKKWEKIAARIYTDGE